MKNYFLTEIKEAVKNWWVSLLVGILAIVVGIWTFFTPGQSLAALTVLFEVALIVAGILEIIFAVSNRKVLYGWGWSLTAGILELLLGVMLIAMPMPSVAVILIYVVGFWILFRSIWSIGASFDLHQVGIRGWGWLLVMGILMALFSFLFLLSPAFGGIFIVVFVGIALLVYGIFRIVLAFDLKALYKDIKDVEK